MRRELEGGFSPVWQKYLLEDRQAEQVQFLQYYGSINGDLVTGFPLRRETSDDDEAIHDEDFLRIHFILR